MSDLIKYYKGQESKLKAEIDRVNRDINFYEVDIEESRLGIEQCKWLKKVLNGELFRVEKALALKGGLEDEHIETVPNT